MPRVPWLLLPLTLALGVVAGRLSVSAAPNVSAASRPPTAGPLVCVPRDEADAEATLPVRLAACQAQLAKSTGPKASFAEPWPKDAGQEAPEAWIAAVDQFIAQCDLGLTLDGVDCEEYPCVALLRGDAAGRDPDALSEHLAGCPAWRRWSEDMVEPETTFEPMELRCPDGSYRSAWVFLTGDAEGAPMAEVTNTDFMSAILMYGRRTSAVARFGRCD